MDGAWSLGGGRTPEETGDLITQLCEHVPRTPRFPLCKNPKGRRCTHLPRDTAGAHVDSIIRELRSHALGNDDHQFFASTGGSLWHKAVGMGEGVGRLCVGRVCRGDEGRPVVGRGLSRAVVAERSGPGGLELGAGRYEVARLA